MDDRRFDSLTKALASGKSRRSVIKGMLGLGGAALAGSTLLESGSEAARRPTPTPKPATCPGQQTLSGGQCICQTPKAPGPQKCGPDCCNPAGVGAAHSECCDNACCYGHCYGEELCCAYPNHYCSSTGACLPEGGCCDADDCAPVQGACAMACVAGQCTSVRCTEGQICCQGECVSSQDYTACPADPSGCCDRETELCCGPGGCCPGDQCNEIVGACCTVDQSPCGTGENACCDAGSTCCGNDRTCCPDGQCTTAGECCSGDSIACAGQCCPEERCSDGVGCCDEGFLACSGGICCKADEYQCSTTGPGCECLPGTMACSELPGGCCLIEQCNQQTLQCCADGTTPCGAVCCTDGLCIDGVCSCTNGLVRCENGSCQECCGSVLGEIDNCQVLYGYDLNCVYCPNGICDTSPFNGAMCDTDDTGELGKCDSGFCIPCGGGPSAPCEINTDCCSGVCLQDIGQCTDP